MVRRLLMTGAAAVLIVSLGMVVGTTRFSPRELPHDFSTHVLALEFATDAGEIVQIVGPSAPEHRDRRLMRALIGVDWVLIAAYALPGLCDSRGASGRTG